MKEETISNQKLTSEQCTQLELQRRVSANSTIRRRDVFSPCPLSFAQEMIWFLNQIEPDSPAYNQPIALRLKGNLDIETLKKSLDAIVARHEVLRTTFVSSDGKPLQVIGPPRSVELPIIDLSSTAGEDQETELDRRMVEITDRPFDLLRDLMLRAALFRLGGNDHQLLLVTYHIASDGWSMGILFRELSILYEALLAGKPDSLPDLAVQYADYAIWQRQRLQGKVLDRQLSYWRQQLADVSPLELPTDRPRGSSQSFCGARQSRIVSERLSQAIRALGRSEGATLFMTLLAAFKALLYRYTGQEDIVIGSPFANRTRIEMESLIGFLVNTLVLRTDLSGNPTFRELLKRVREVALGAYAHPDAPFEKLMAGLEVERTLSRHTLFQVMFALQNYPRQVLRLPGLTANLVEVPKDTAKFDLTLYAVEEKEGLRISLEYNTDLFDKSSIKQMLHHFENLLEGIVANFECPLSDLPVLSAPERHQLLVKWNQTQRLGPQDGCIHELFEAQVERTPDAVAVVFEDKRLTYKQLNQRANQLAHHLRKLGVGAESRVGLCMDRSLDLLISLLGILKAGAAYVPLDPIYPKERLAFISSEANLRVILTQEALLERQHPTSSREAKIADHIVVCIDRDWSTIQFESNENLSGIVRPDNLAYIIFTSGSTGTPKGVMICHGSVCNYLLWRSEYFPLTPADRLLQRTSFSFDDSVWEFFEALTVGASLIIAGPSDYQDLSALLRLISKHKITAACFVPSMLQALLEHPDVEDCKHLRRVTTGAETLSPELVERFFTRFAANLYNGYGPSEATIGVTFWACDRVANRCIVPIGRPIANTQVYILDSNLEPVPIRGRGEIYIGGAGLARGYLKRPDLTAENFIPNPFSDEPGARLYKTGDLARYLHDGNIEFLGRSDDQIKIRGFRIELGEIESVLRQAAGVRDTVVASRTDHPKDPRLVAYVLPSQAPFPRANELRSFVKSKLPGYMVPSTFVFLDTLPLMPNGKIDRRALPAPQYDLEKTYAAPRSPVEEMIAEIWAEILNLSTVGIHDNFFDLGGHSLLATQAISRVCQALKLDIPLRVLFERPTVAELASEIKEGRQRYDVSPPPNILAIPRQLRSLNL